MYNASDTAIPSTARVAMAYPKGCVYLGVDESQDETGLQMTLSTHTQTGLHCPPKWVRQQQKTDCGKICGKKCVVPIGNW